VFIKFAKKIKKKYIVPSRTRISSALEATSFMELGREVEMA